MASWNVYSHGHLTERAKARTTRGRQRHHQHRRIEMPDPSLSILAAALRPVFSAVTQHVARLHAERSAVRPTYNASLLEHTINDTLNRLKGGNITDTWWRNLLTVVEHKYVAPDFLKVHAIREWLGQEKVAKDFKVLAADLVMGAPVERPKERERLAIEYTKCTGEDRHRAHGPIDVLTGILVAGYLSSIPANQRALAGMLQQVHGSFNERLDNLEEKQVAALTEVVTERFPIVQLLTPHVEKELSEILSLRALDQAGARQRIQQLFKRVNEGDLSAIEDSVKHNVYQWTARLCATQKDTLSFAKEIRSLLAEITPRTDLSIVDALIFEADGDGDAALRTLRDAEDRESRSVWFGLLVRVRGEEKALEWFDQRKPQDNRAFFSGAGWVGWAIASAKCERWESTAEVLLALQDMWDEMPALPIIEGSVNAAMLLPQDFRSRVLDGMPLVHGIAPTPGMVAERYHARATECFGYAERRLRGQIDEGWIKALEDWSLWLRLMDPERSRREAARAHIEAEMQDGAKAAILVPFAFSFEINFDPLPLRAYLEQRRELGGLDDRARLAEFIVNAQFLEPSAFIEYLNKSGEDLIRVVPPEFFTSQHVESILDDDRSSDDARKIIDQHRAILDEHHAKRLEMMVDAYEGDDVRSKLEELYQETDSIVDLRNLIEFLKRANDRQALLPLCRELYRRTPTVECAFDVVASLSEPSSFDWEEIIRFLDENDHLLEHSEQLRNAKSAALYHSGTYSEAKSIVERSKAKKLTPENLRLGLNIAIASGDWEAIGGMLNEAWTLREEHDAHALVSLAHLSGQQSETRDRGLELLKLAAARAPEDAAVLAAVYWQHFQFGHDEEADPQWLLRAMELSTEKGGPIWKRSLPDIAEDWLPKRRDHLIEVDRKWVQGEIPISVAAEAFNVSLSRLLLHTPKRNADVPDGRRRMVLPIVAADRPDIDIDEDWTVGIDVTAILVLQYLGILEEVLNSLSHAKFSPDIFEYLFRERTEARFHQPSRINAAKRLLELHGRKLVQDLEVEQRPSRSLIKEAGQETAEVLQWAKTTGGIAVCVRPIYSAGSLMEKEADVGEHGNVIVSLTSFVGWLSDTGRLGSEVYGRIRAVLKNSGDTEDAALPSDLVNRAVCFDRLALQYVNDAGALPAVASAVGVVRIHNNVFQEMRALTEEGEFESDIVSNIDRVRHTLRSRIQEGRASFLPRSATQLRRGESRFLRLEATASLLEGSAECHALYIDDRFMNSHATFLGPDGQHKPILSSLDTIRHLVKTGQMTLPDYCRTRHRLRSGGFAFVPLEAEEICYWVGRTSMNNGQLPESVELRVLRQTAARGDSLVLTNWHQAFALASNSRAACTRAISALWEETEQSPETIMAWSAWIWRNLMATVVPGHQVLDQVAYRNLVSEVVSLRIGSLLLPLPTRTQELQEWYSQWLDQVVLQHLRPANADRIHAALANAKSAIESLDIDRAAYGNLFLEQLPEQARGMLIRADPKFAERCGYRAERAFTIGTDLQLSDGSLFAAAIEAFDAKDPATVLDMSGIKVSVSCDEEGENVRLHWVNQEGAEQEASMPELCLLSRREEIRQTTFARVATRLGPTFEAIDRVKEEISLGRPDLATLSMVFDASSNGMAAVQRTMAQKILGGQPMAQRDFVPESISYFEQLVGPVAGGEPAETYMQDSLKEYRQELLDRDLQGGLHICCLGAVHDDLSPGQWLSQVNDDTLWATLEAVESGFNPFSRLGALDVALYRQHDERFRKYALGAVRQLLHQNLGFSEETDVYRLLQIVGDFVLNRVNLLENGATKPGYWKRLGAWMHAGYIVETTLKSPYAISLDVLEGWSHENMAAAGAYANLIDARTEPMLFAARMLPTSLRYEVLGRLELLRRRHEASGREVPASDEIDRLLEEFEEKGLTPALRFPGPLEGDKRPMAGPPTNVEAEIHKVAEAEDGNLLPFLATLSQLFSLDEQTLEVARVAIERSCEGIEEEGTEGVLQKLELASVVAAANRSTSLSAAIGDALVKVSPFVSEREVEGIGQILLQAAAAFEEEREWFEWLDDKLVEVVGQLPSHPSPALRTFLGHLEEIEIVLPTDRWFHSRARLGALVGAV